MLRSRHRAPLAKSDRCRRRWGPEVLLRYGGIVGVLLSAGVIDLGLEVINPVIEPGEVLPNVIGINPVLVGELRDHHVVGVESTLHHPLAL
ncbi:DNA-directed RNA polymerase subunit beta [Hordeum vulgare]|nr:DNA-directed RNA polymerase subunit beta [Hordeum vulgare]